MSQDNELENLDFGIQNFMLVPATQYFALKFSFYFGFCLLFFVFFISCELLSTEGSIAVFIDMLCQESIILTLK